MVIHINYAAVIVAALANYIIGSLWYGVLFTKQWKTLSGISEMKLVPGFIVLGLVASFLMSYVLDHALIFASGYMKMSGVGGGLMCGFFNWLGFIAPVTLGVVMYQKKSWMLWILDNAYWLLSLLVMGAILALWK
jgi:Protein of unknown function (DUF1761)